ncbi:MAG: ABC transporter substrate-binding protein [Gemmatimonadales bacterium]|nr:ABC transporter substrate-binding protein [Gemmatimonadales bacterium]
MKRRIPGLLLAVLLTAAPTAASAQKPTEVTIAHFADLTGPIATSAVAIDRGLRDYLRWAQEDGNDPIPGLKVNLVWEDTAYSADRYVPTYKKFKDGGAVLLVNESSTANSVLGELVRADRVPVISPGTGYIPGFFPREIARKGPSYIFFDRPPYPDFFAAVATHFLGQWKAGGFPGKPKAMFITWDTPYGRGPVELGTLWAQSAGFEMLPAQLFPSGTIDLTQQLLKAQELGANLIYMNSVEGHFAMLIKGARRFSMPFGVGPGKVLLVGGSESHNDDLLRLAGEAAEGVWAVSSYPNWDEDVKAVKWAKEVQTKYHGKVDARGNYFMGFTFGRVAWEALKQTAKKYGPDKVTRENITRTLTEIRNLDMWGAAPPFSYGPNERRPFRTMLVHAVKGGRWVRLATVETPWITAPTEETGLPGWRPGQK